MGSWLEIAHCAREPAKIITWKTARTDGRTDNERARIARLPLVLRKRFPGLERSFVSHLCSYGLRHSPFLTQVPVTVPGRVSCEKKEIKKKLEREREREMYMYSIYKKRERKGMEGSKNCFNGLSVRGRWADGDFCEESSSGREDWIRLSRTWKSVSDFWLVIWFDHERFFRDHPFFPFLLLGNCNVNVSSRVMK